MLEDGGPDGEGFDFKLNNREKQNLKLVMSTRLSRSFFLLFLNHRRFYIGDGMVMNITSLFAKAYRHFHRKVCKRKISGKGK